MVGFERRRGRISVNRSTAIGGLAEDIQQRILGPLEEAERRDGKESNEEGIAEGTGSEPKS